MYFSDFVIKCLVWFAKWNCNNVTTSCLKIFEWYALTCLDSLTTLQPKSVYRCSSFCHSLRSKAWFGKALASLIHLHKSNKGKKDAGYPRKKYSFLAFNLDNRVENAPDIDAAAKMGHISSKSAGAAESQTDSFEESPYLGPSGLHLGLQNPSISVSQGLCQLQVKLSTKDWNT